MKQDKKVVGDAMDEFKTQVHLAVDNLKEKLALPKKQEYRALSYLMGGVIHYILSEYIRDVDLEDFTKFLTCVREDFKDCIESEDEDENKDDDNECPCGQEGCTKAVVKHVSLTKAQAEQLENLLKTFK